MYEFFIFDALVLLTAKSRALQEQRLCKSIYDLSFRIFFLLDYITIY